MSADLIVLQYGLEVHEGAQLDRPSGTTPVKQLYPFAAHLCSSGMKLLRWYCRRAALGCRQILPPTGSPVTPNTIGIVAVAAFGRECARPATRYGDHPHPAVHEIGCQLGKSGVLAFRPAEFQRHVLSFLITRLGEAFAKSGYLLGPLGGRAEIEKPDHRHRRLLRPRRKRPRRRRAAEQRDELAALSLDHLVCGRKQAGRYRQTQCFGSMEINGRFKFRR